MKYQISFEHLARVHWAWCESLETAQSLYGALSISPAKNIEILENPGKENAKWMHREFEAAKRAA